MSAKAMRSGVSSLVANQFRQDLIANLQFASLFHTDYLRLSFILLCLAILVFLAGFDIVSGNLQRTSDFVLISVLPFLMLIPFLIALYTLVLIVSAPYRTRQINSLVFLYLNLALFYAVIYFTMYIFMRYTFGVEIFKFDNGQDHLLDDFRYFQYCLLLFIDMCYYSFITMTTLGYGDIAPRHWLIKFLAISEISMGIYITVVALSRYFANVSGGNSKDRER